MMLWTYAIYVIVSAALTIWVGHTLHSRGRVFLVANFDGQESLADSVNHLLLVGFCLVNFGFVALALRYGEKPTDGVTMVEFLSTKIGLAIVVLGLMHFSNVRLLMRFRTSGLFRSVLGSDPRPGLAAAR
jgi:hypothetical protein